MHFVCLLRPQSFIKNVGPCWCYPTEVNGAVIFISCPVLSSNEHEMFFRVFFFPSRRTTKCASASLAVLRPPEADLPPPSASLSAAVISKRSRGSASVCCRAATNGLLSHTRRHGGGHFGAAGRADTGHFVSERISWEDEDGHVTSTGPAEARLCTSMTF